MEILRYSRNQWGQTVLEGVSWDLLWIFFGAAVVFIVVHMVYMFICRRKRRNTNSGGV